ncbi:DUF5789 family protein [Haloarchaeobius litoreus]|nr:hypothetical protein [Haloarchaeobius litoreus]
MAPPDEASSDGPSDSREHGVEFGPLMEQLESHEYPTTLEELLAAYGDAELDLVDGSTTLREVLGEQSESTGEQRYESAEEVQQSVLNMVGEAAVGREGYSDRGGETPDESADSDEEPESV